MSIYSETLSNTPDVDLHYEDCDNCDFECGTVGYCLKKCGETFIICSLFIEKGYTLAHDGWGRRPDGRAVPAIELYKRESKRLMANLEKLGHTCTVYQHPEYKKYMCAVIVDDGVDPIDLAVDFKRMEAIK